MINPANKQNKKRTKKQIEISGFQNNIKNNILIDNNVVYALTGEEKLKLADLINEKLYLLKEIKEVIEKAKRLNCRIFIIFKNEISKRFKPIMGKQFTNGYWIKKPINFYLIRPIKGFEGIGYSPKEFEHIIEKGKGFSKCKKRLKTRNKKLEKERMNFN